VVDSSRVAVAFEGHRLRNVWIGAAIVDVALVVLAVLVGVAIARELDCLFYCTEEERQTGGGFWLLAGTGVAALLGGLTLAARVTGVDGWDAVRQGFGGMLVLGLALVVAGALPGVVALSVFAAAIGLAGSLAIRAPVDGSTRARRLSIAAVAALALLLQSLGEVPIVAVLLAAAPAIALADTVTLLRRPSPES
jgi:hypothetical protein